MYKFGNTSQDRLKTCNPLIQEILEEAIKIVDFSVICGHRTKESKMKPLARDSAK